MKLRIRNSALSGSDAFTLTEIVISAFILSIGAAALMGCFSFGFFGMRMARENQRATQIMLERAEAIRLCSWDQVNSNGFIPDRFYEYYDPTVTNGTYDYTGRVSISSFNLSPTPSYSTNLRQLTITLQWVTRNVVRSRTNVTYISKDGVQNYVF